MLLLATCLTVQFIATTRGAQDARSVHVALETALTFNNKDGAKNIQFIDDFQNFLTKIRKHVTNKDTPSRRSYRDNEIERKQKDTVNAYISNLKFSDFFKELIDVLKNYDNNDLEDVFMIVDDEIRKYHYKGCKFYELVSDSNVRRFIADKLDLVKEKPAEDIRTNLDEMLQLIEDAKFDSKKSELLDYVNSLYTRRDAHKFKKVLGYFIIYQQKSKRANMGLITLVRDTLRNLIFDHYSNLNLNTRRDFKARLETYFWKNDGQRDGMQRLEWTVKYKKVTEKEKQNSKEITSESTPLKRKGKQSVTLNIQAKNKKSNAGNLDLHMNNQMEIIKSNDKHNASATVESEDVSVNKLKMTREVQREELDMNKENTEQIESKSREDSGTVSEDVSDEGYNIAHPVQIDEDNGSRHAKGSSAGVKLITKSKRHKTYKKYTTQSIDANEVEQHQRFKGFTNGNIGRLGNIKKGFDMRDSSIYPNPRKFTPTAKKRKHKMETTIGSRNRMQTLWEESRTQNYRENKNEEVADIHSDNDDDLKSQTHKENEKIPHLKQTKTKNKSKHKAKDVNNIKKKAKRTNKIKKEKMDTDFSLQTHLEKVQKDSRELRFQLELPIKKYNGISRLVGRMAADDKSENGESSIENKTKKSSNITKKHSKSSSDTSTETLPTELIKQHKDFKRKVKKPITRSKEHKIIEKPKEETYIISQEVTTTELPRKINQKSNTDPPTTGQQSDENEINYSGDEKIQTKITKRPKKKILTEIKHVSTTHKSLETSIDEEDNGYSGEGLQSTTKATKKERKPNKNTKSTTPKHSEEQNEQSTEQADESAETEITKNKHKKRKKTTKHHIRKTKFKTDTKSSEEHIESLEKKTLDQKSIKIKPKQESKEKETSLSKQNTFTKSVADIFISVENEEHYPIKRIKTARSSIKKVTESVSFPKESQSSPTPTPKEAKYEQDNFNNTSNNLIIPIRSDEATSQEKVVNTKELVSTSTPTPMSTSTPITTSSLVETPTEASSSSEETVTTSISISSRKPYKAMDIPIKADVTGLLNSKLFRSTDKNETAPSTESAGVFRRMNTEENLPKTSRSYLQLIDIIDNDKTMTINIDAMEPVTDDDKETNFKTPKTDYILPPSDFWLRHGNKVKIKTNVTNTIINLTSTTGQEITTKTYATTAQSTEQSNNETNDEPRKHRKKKKKRRRTTTPTTNIPTITIPTTTISTPTTTTPTTTTPTTAATTLTTIAAASTNVLTTNTDLRRANEENDLVDLNQPKPPDVDTPTKNIDPKPNNKIDDYYNYDNNTGDNDNLTLAIGDDMKDFLDKFSIKLDAANGTSADMNLEAMKELMGPDIGNEAQPQRPNIEAELKAEKARILADKDLMKMYGKTFSYVTLSTIPWNTLYTDALDSVIGMNIL